MHLPNDCLTPNQVRSLRAWFARRAGDVKLEQRTLEELTARDRGAIWAMERLAEMLLSAGRPTEAEKWRHTKGDQEKTKDWYVYHIFPKDRLDHSPELARAAEKVGRMFEARCWWELAAKRPDWAGEAREQIARLDRESAESTTDSSGPTPATLSLTVRVPTLIPPPQTLSASCCTRRCRPSCSPPASCGACGPSHIQPTTRSSSATGLVRSASVQSAMLILQSYRALRS